MQASGYLDRETWQIGAQLAVVDCGPDVSIIAVEHPSNSRSSAEVLGRDPLRLLVSEKAWLLRNIALQEVAMPITTPLNLAYFEIEKEEVAGQSA